MTEQLNLFGEEDLRPKAKRPARGSQSSIVFHDYESFLAKFSDNPKTTDDCFTPKDVYEAVVKYVGTIYDMSDKVVLSFDDEEVTSVWTWRKSEDGKGYVLDKIE